MQLLFPDGAMPVCQLGCRWGLGEMELRVGSNIMINFLYILLIVQELCESRGGCPGLSVLMNLLVSVDIKLY